MELELEKISVALLDAKQTHKAFKEELLYIKKFSIHAVFVLPYLVNRAKHLLSGTAINVASIADYPFGTGSFAKKAFEMGQLYSDGAREVYVSLIEEQVLSISQKNYQIFEQLSFGRSDFGVFLNVQKMSDSSRRNLSHQIVELDMKSIFIGDQLTVEEAMYQLIHFRSTKKKDFSIQVSVQSPTLLEIEMLFQAGASVVCLSNYRQLFPLISKTNGTPNE